MVFIVFVLRSTKIRSRFWVPVLGGSWGALSTFTFRGVLNTPGHNSEESLLNARAKPRSSFAYSVLV